MFSIAWWKRLWVGEQADLLKPFHNTTVREYEMELA